MSPTHSEQPGATGLNVAPGRPENPPAAGNAPARGRGRALLVIGAALVAGVLAWLAGESSLAKVPAKTVPTDAMGHTIMATSIATVEAAKAATALRQNSAFGLLLGLALGAVGGVARRSPRRAALGALVGVVAAAVVTSIGVPAFFRFRDSFTDEIVPSFLYHGAVGAAIGAAAGLGVAVETPGRGTRVIRAILGGALGALLGAAVYVVVASILLASSDAGEPVPGTAVARLAARLLVAAFIGLGVIAGLGGWRRAGPAR
jgi:hypothetical protein